MAAIDIAQLLRAVVIFDDLDLALQRAKAAGFPIEYGPAAEPWGFRGSFCAIRSAS